MKFAIYSRQDVEKAVIHYVNEEGEDKVVNLYLEDNQLQSKDELQLDEKELSPIFAPINGESRIARELYTEDLVTARKEYVAIHSEDLFQASLPSSSLSFRDWHCLSAGGKGELCTLQVSKGSTLTPLLIRDGVVAMYPIGSISRPASGDEAESAALEELSEWLEHIEGETVLHVLFCPIAERMYVFDVLCLSGMWLSALPRIKRIELLEALMPTFAFDYVGPIRQLASLTSEEPFDSDWQANDELMGMNAFGRECFLLAFSLGYERPFYWVDPRVKLDCRVLSKQLIAPSALPEYRYGLGLAESNGEDVLFQTVESFLDAELDGIIRLDAFIPLSIGEGQRIQLPMMPRVVETLDDGRDASSLYVPSAE